ncbi:MAG: hypothetical protein CBC35_04495 [Planctomycetes bacterium TMED75]|nr:hypothetical protein [Planctomycetaceae bacterium]OUU94124.1 MAG: hypothetical protein CBC35_04495 [Planctomycetes bacterium TMED75]
MSHAHVPIDLSDRNIELGSTGSVARLACFALGILALIAAILLAVTGNVEWPVFWRSWLQNWIFVLEISLGTLFFVFIQHLTKAGWSTVVRRPAEVLASNLNWLWLGFVPIAVLIFMGDAGKLFPWTDMAMLAEEAPEEAHLVEGKLAFLNVPFFMIRAAIYFIIWAFLGTWFLRMSIRQGRDGGLAATRTMQKMAPVAAILFGLSVTFAAFDWMMSLSPAWFSTMFGVYAFCGTATCGFSVMIIVCLLLQRNGYMVNLITREHYQDMGKFLFAFGMVFWAYIGFSQYMLIWYANIPEETGWFLARQLGEWGWFSAWLLFGHFCIPFVFLISRHPKRDWKTLMIAAVWMLFFGWFDVYWLVMPMIPHDLASFATYDAAAEAYASERTGIFRPVNWLLLVGMLSIFAGVTIGRLRSHPLVCRKDPWLDKSVGFENF